MSAVKRHTTRYVADEDRLHLLVEMEDGEVVTLALTRRLMNQVVPPLLQRLEQNTGTAKQAAAASQAAAPQKAAALQRFAQSSAVRSMTAQSSVKDPETAAPALVRSVDIKPRDGRLILALKSTENGDVLQSLPFNATTLRQWLGVVRSQYQKGGWGENIWPKWMTPDAVSADEARLN